MTINGDAHRRVWDMHVKGEGGYSVAVDAPVGGFVNPRLAFGDNAGMEWPIWVLLGLAFSASTWRSRSGGSRRRRRRTAPERRWRARRTGRWLTRTPRPTRVFGWRS